MYEQPTDTYSYAATSYRENHHDLQQHKIPLHFVHIHSHACGHGCSIAPPPLEREPPLRSHMVKVLSLWWNLLSSDVAIGVAHHGACGSVKTQDLFTYPFSCSHFTALRLSFHAATQNISSFHRQPFSCSQFTLSWFQWLVNISLFHEHPFSCSHFIMSKLY